MQASRSTRVATAGGALLLPLLVGLLALAPAPLGATVYLTVDEALALAFPGCEIERSTLYLTDAERARAAELAGEAIDSGIAHRYTATCEGAAGGRAYFDTHRVRTLPETLMIALDPDGQVRRIEVLAFREPPDYLPGGAWYEQFDGARLDQQLRLRGRIRDVAGATLTARATTSAVRRLLAVDRVLEERREGPS